MSPDGLLVRVGATCLAVSAVAAVAILGTSLTGWIFLGGLSARGVVRAVRRRRQGRGGTSIVTLAFAAMAFGVFVAGTLVGGWESGVPDLAAIAAAASAGWAIEAALEPPAPAQRSVGVTDSTDVGGLGPSH